MISPALLRQGYTIKYLTVKYFKPIIEDIVCRGGEVLIAIETHPGSPQPNANWTQSVTQNLIAHKLPLYSTQLLKFIPARRTELP